MDSEFTQPEWNAAFAQDPTGERGLLLPIRVRDCALGGLLSQIVYVDLVGLDGGDPGDADLTLSWTLRDAPITTRDELTALLSRLPHALICEVTVHLQREKG